MKNLKSLFSLVLAFSLSLAGWSQEITSPADFLGYEPGENFTRHHQIVDYFELLSEQSNQVQVSKYGQTNERRPLLLAYISSPENLENIESIRENNLAQAGIASKTPEKNGISIVWLSYNVHGNEASSSEAAMKTVYKLITEKQEWLKNTVVIMDPCVNPDGRDRYVNWFNEVQSKPYNVSLDAKEHNEGWPGGRPNHYLFDLNRDWAWLTQVESQQRIAVYNKWLPQVHVDFHEQGINEPYYFAPAAEPFHEVITDWQRKFQTEIGRNHAKYFDAEGWLYFTRERFDLFYPSYGDTYPTYMGAIGMTYEQAGHTRGGLGVRTAEGEILTLIDRVDHHTTTGLSTVEMASKNSGNLVDEFQKFYQNHNATYANYVLKSENSDNLTMLLELLDKHEIQYQQAKKGVVKGYHYQKQKNDRFSVSDKDIVVSINQPKGKMVQVLFEPKAKLSDSLTYDITAWSLPYAYGLETVATASNVPTQSYQAPSFTPMSEEEQSSYGYVASWNSIKDATFLSALLQENIQVRFTEKTFEQNGKIYTPGSLIILKRDNNGIDFSLAVPKIANELEITLDAVQTGFSDKGVDFGAYNVKKINKQRVAVLSGEETSSLSFGEVWHFFETQLKYPITIIDSEDIQSVNLSKYDVLIFPNGYYSAGTVNKAAEFAKSGGTLIGMGDALASFKSNENFNLGSKAINYENSADLDAYSSRERRSISNYITGAIFKANLDTSHPLAFGYGSEYFSLKLSGQSYDLLSNGGVNVGYFPRNASAVSGFAGYKAAEQVPESLLFGEQNMGRGTVIYMVDNPLFRSFWQEGKLFMANAVFLCNSDKFRL